MGNEISLDMDQVADFAGQVLATLTGGATAAMMVVGDRLGLYAALAESGPLTSAALAERTGTTERYVREWLAQQAAVGFVTFDRATDAFTLPLAHAAVLATEESPAAAIGVAPLITGMHRRLDEVADAFRTGAGIPWGEQDPTTFDSAERFLAVDYRNNLVGEWIPSLEGMHERLSEGASVADIGCGHGAALILLADAYPNSRFVGYDVHKASIEAARKRAADAGLSDRVHFEVAHCHGYPTDGFDLIMFLASFHDLGDPVGAAAYARTALGDGGRLMLVEMQAGNDLEETLAIPSAGLNYAASTFLCTTNSLSQPVGLALGGQAGERRLTDVLAAAGYERVHRVAQSQFNFVLEARP